MNNDVPQSLSRFGGELERAIKRELGRAPAAKRLSRPRLLAGTTLGLAGIATALALVLSAASSSPAYAVTRNHDGTVSVKVMRPEGVAGANAKLARMNVRVKLVQVAARCPAPRPPLPGRYQVVQASLKPWRIPRGRTLVIGVRRDGRAVHVTPARLVAAGAVPDCMTPLLPPPCHWPVGRYRDMPAPKPPVPSRMTPRQVRVPACRTRTGRGARRAPR